MRGVLLRQPPLLSVAGARRQQTCCRAATSTERASPRIMTLRRRALVSGERAPASHLGGMIMSSRLCRMSLAVLAAWLALAGRAAAVAPEIRDEGKFFSPEA